MRRAWLLVLALLPSCAPDQRRVPDAAEIRGTRSGERRIELQPLMELRDGEESILARPFGGWLDGGGRLIVPDASDRDIKVYAADGARAATLGRAGRGPGEFSGLSSAQPYRDSVVALDVAQGLVMVFGPDGRFVRSFPAGRAGRARPALLRVVDDSLFLLVGFALGAEGGDLLALLRPDGTRKSTLFNPGSRLGSGPELVQYTGVVADGAGGLVFAALTSGDSVYAFDYQGRRLGAHAADPVQPLVPLQALVAGNHGRAQRPDGTYVMDGARQIFGIVALDSATAAVRIAPYDARHGTDFVDPGTVVLFSADVGGDLRVIARAEVEAGLVGRDREGRALLMRPAAPDAETYLVERMHVRPAQSADRT